MAAGLTDHVWELGELIALMPKLAAKAWGEPRCAVLGASCGSNDGCCAGCSPPAGACPGDGLGQVTPMSDDAGGADATGEQ